MTGSLHRTPLFDWHRAHGGRLVDFAGWEMPVQYTSIVEEHVATRTAAGLFDVSHMGRFRFDGRGAASFLDHLVTRRVVDMPLGRVRYALATNAQGGILDDVLVYHLAELDGSPFHMMVVNAGNRTKMSDWVHAHLNGSEDVNFLDITTHTAMIAVQGPQALELAQSLVSHPLRTLKNYACAVSQVEGMKAIVSRTGYTGEDGCELVVPAAVANSLWEKLLAAGAAAGIKAAGLGARDTLRLEAAMPLYGHELSETIGPHQAGLAFAVNLEGREFVGKQAVARSEHESQLPRRVGLEMAGKRVPRENFAVLHNQQTVGHVTSGTFSPTLGRPLAMAYVQPEFAEVGRELAVDIRGRPESARVVPLPFYRRAE